MDKSVDNVEKCEFSTVIHRDCPGGIFSFLVHIRLHNFGFYGGFMGYVAMENREVFQAFSGKKLSFSPIGAEYVWRIGAYRV